VPIHSGDAVPAIAPALAAIAGAFTAGFARHLPPGDLRGGRAMSSIMTSLSSLVSAPRRPTSSFVEPSDFESEEPSALR
jgi:hypothetical protein